MNLYLDAIEKIKNEAKALPKLLEKIKLHEAHGRILGERVLSEECVPAFDNSSMDGYAVRSSETKVGNQTLKVLKRIIAGDAPESITDLNVAIQIMTGAPIPSGFDAVIKVEDVLPKQIQGKEEIEFQGPVPEGQFIRRAGTDFKKGKELGRAGDLLDAKRIMGMSALGIREVKVIRKPKVWIISTGAEIVEYDHAEIKRGEIRNSSAPFLVHELRRLGCEVFYQGIIKDVTSDYERTLQAALEEQVDLVVSTGALSMGVHDFAKDSVVRLGGEVLFHKVAIRPGKPVLFARFQKYPRTHFMGLPGNPISTVVGVQFFMRPFLDEYFQQNRPRVNAILQNTFEKPEGIRCFLKGRWFVNEKGESCVTLLDGQASFMIHSLIEANAWVVVSENRTKATAGQILEVYPFESGE